MIKLTRIENEVYFEGNKLRIVAQATKGPNMEVVNIAGLEGSNGQKWIMLKNVKEGEHEYETQGRDVQVGYKLTEEEQARIAELQAEIDTIKQAAKDRYVRKPNLNVNPANMTLEERLAKIEELKAYYGI